MTMAELEACLGWLERHRLSEHVNVLEGDPRYAWAAAQRRRSAWRKVGLGRGPEC
jgi:hypothetical protein